MNQPLPSKRPGLLAILRLRCPYCTTAPLLKKGSFFDFDVGCPHCHYRYEREVGYFSGATWMVNFPVISLTGLAFAALLMIYAKGLGTIWMAASIAIFVSALGLVFFPWGCALWLWADHLIHPLQEKDRI